MSDSPEIAATTDAIVSFRRELLASRRPGHVRHALPSRSELRSIVADLRAVLFPDHFGGPDLTEEGVRYSVARTLEGALAALEEQIRCALWFGCGHAPNKGDCPGCAADAAEVRRAFARRLPHIRSLLGGDVQAAFDGDPAAKSFDEVVLCYPGFAAVTYYRIAHELHQLGVPLVPRMLGALGHAATAVDVHPAAQIGGRFFIDHGTGVVIGETCVIGERVRLYQGVTLGAKSFPLDEHGHPVKGVARHPIVEDDVVIYAGATLLGRITIGKGSSIGGNVWLTRSVPPGSRVTQAQARQESYEEGGGI